MSSSISYKWDLWMVAALVCVAVVLGIYPVDRTVWCVEMVWTVGLWAILLLTRRKFRFSPPAYLCFFVWTVLQLVGAWLCRRLEDGTVVRRRITETEVYCGEEDTACHAHKGRTARTDVMYSPGGYYSAP